MKDFKSTLCLPKTGFPMKANLTKKELEILDFWQKNSIYEHVIRAAEERPVYVLHDGPPYANGRLHMGHALNKILKDFIIKSKIMRGLKAEFVPGWDCHGLPIEHKVEGEIEAEGKKKDDLPVLEVRRRCREYALKFLDIQREEFIRLGVFGDWGNPYVTMDPEYEATTAEILCTFVENGSVTRGKKPIHWCLSCQTALAEAEVEYDNHTSPSVFVKFPIEDGASRNRIKELFPGADPLNTFAVIWTTTPWTLPANQAVALHPDFEYGLYEVNGEFLLLAVELAKSCLERFGREERAPVAGTKIKGEQLAALICRHPFMNRSSLLVLADYVTLEAGSGLVHTAPGHGREDYETGLRYNLEVLSPLDDEGRFTEQVSSFPEIVGKNVFEANPIIVEKLRDKGLLLSVEKISHEYPHCWRCKKPVIFRATTQWFISMEKNELRTRALKAIETEVKWIPEWGKERIYGMIANRPDWCISRQRAWGVPILALLCKKCDYAFNDPAWMRNIAEHFAAHPTGCDWWFEAEMEEVLPPGLTCPVCGGTDWEKEDDILDVWFDSGTSFAAVLEKRPECRFPADLYLEGSDQHRGFFHSSLLASIGARNRAPYRAVLTHGYVVDGEGRKMSKSVGNVISPEEIIRKYGAEILRLWVAAVDYQGDVRISEEILSRLVEAYRRIRNTCRFILGNLRDFRADLAVPEEQMLPLDRYCLNLVRREHEVISKAYENFEFHKVFHRLQNLCVTDLSAFYLDILKDRLYVSAARSLERRSAQTALVEILLVLMRDMAPLLSFTAEELFAHFLQELSGDLYQAESEEKNPWSVFALRPLEPWPTLPEAEREFWDNLLLIRSEVTKAIEPLRKAGEIGHSLDAKVTFFAEAGPFEILSRLSIPELREILIVSSVSVIKSNDFPENAYQPEEVADLGILIQRAEGEKCPRCWLIGDLVEVGKDKDGEAWPKACPRCAEVLRKDWDVTNTA